MSLTRSRPCANAGLHFPNTKSRAALAPDTLSSWALLAVIGALLNATAPVYGATNNPPVISGVPPQSINEKAAFSFLPTASDSDGDTLRFWVKNRPRWMRVDSRTGRLSGTPNYEDAGVYRHIKLVVGDGAGGMAALGPFAVTVKHVNRPPRIYGWVRKNIPEGDDYSFTPNANDPDGDKLTFGISGKPHWATFNAADGTLSGTPSYNDANTYPDIAISVSDGSTSTSLTPFAIKVSNTNRPPIISGTLPTNVRETEAYSFIPTASDPDGDTLRFWVKNRPRWMRVDSRTGRLSGTPNYEDAGVYSDIKLFVGDGVGRTTALGPFAITVEDVNRPPRISGTPSPRAVEEGKYQFAPEAWDADGDKLTFSIFNKPNWVAFDEQTGTLAGVPPQGSLGFYDDILISVSDGTDVVDMDPFSIYVYNDGQSDSPVGFYSLDRVVPLPFVDGVVMRQHWRDIEPQEGVYDFSYFDKSIREAEAVGQKVVIFCWPQKAPSWLLKKSRTFMHKGVATIVPWDETMLEAFQKLAFAVASHEIDGIPLRDHPAVAYVHATIGGINHIRLFNLPQGYTPELFEESVLRSLHIWADAFPESIDFMVGIYEKIVDGIKNPSTAETLRERILQEFDGINRPNVHIFQEHLTGLSPKITGPHGELAQGMDGRTGICFQACGAWTLQDDEKWKNCNWLEPVDTPELGIENGFYNYGARYFEFYPRDLKNNDYYDQFMDWHQLVHE